VRLSKPTNSQRTEMSQQQQQSSADETRMDEEANDGPATVDAGTEPAMTLRNPTDRPVYKLSVKLLDTYKYINKVCFKNLLLMDLILSYEY
jgi:hypothetical protein